MSDVLLRLRSFTGHADRTIVIGENQSNQWGYTDASVADPGSVSDDQYKGVAIGSLQTTDFSPFADNRFRILFRDGDGSTPANFFSLLIIETAHLGTLNLLAADAEHTNGSTFTTFDWFSSDLYYRPEDVGLTLGWGIW